MPSVTYMNQSAPFWDFLASLEQQSSQNRDTETENEHQQEHNGPPASLHPFGPWGWDQFFGGPRGMPHRGPPPPHGPPPHHHDHDGEAERSHKEKDGDKDAEMSSDNEKDGDNDNGEGPSGNLGSDNEGRAHGRGHYGRCGGGRRGRCAPGGPGGFGPRHGPPHHGPGHRHGPGHHHGPPNHGSGFHRHDHGGRGPWGPRGRQNQWNGFGGFPLGGLFNPSNYGGAFFDPSNLAAQFWNQFNDSHPTNINKKDNPETAEDYTPDADVFDTETAFVVHISLPGAKKEDVGVNWDAEKSELSVAGVIYRPGDEEFLKTLAMSERKAGPFERKIRLGTRATPAHIDADGITAKLEDGVLRVEVPKLDSGYVEIRKVDIE